MSSFGENRVGMAWEVVAISPRQNNKLNPLTPNNMMPYETSKLKNVAQCDVILIELESDKVDLVAKISTLGRDLTDDGRQALSIPQEAAIAQSELVNLQNTLATLTPGTEDYLRKERDIGKKQTELKTLEIRALMLDGPDYILRQYAFNGAESRLADLEAIKTAVQARKTELQGSANAA